MSVTTATLPAPLNLARTESHPSLIHSTSSDDHLPSHQGISSAYSEALLTPSSGQHELSLTRSASGQASGSPDIDAAPEGGLMKQQQQQVQVQGQSDERGRKNRLWGSKSTVGLRSKSIEKEKKDKESKKDKRMTRMRASSLNNQCVVTCFARRILPLTGKTAQFRLWSLHHLSNQLATPWTHLLRNHHHHHQQVPNLVDSLDF